MRKRLLITAAVLFPLLVFATWQASRSRTWQLFGTIVPRVETQRKVVALTFDDGPQADTVDGIVATLAQHDVKATFFVCGAEIRDHPQAAAKLVAAGHELGNHSYSHQRMVFKSPSYIRNEIERTDALIRAAGHRGPIHFRAPYCKKLYGLPRYLADHQRVHVTFDVEPETFVDEKHEVISYVIDQVQHGSIVLLHPWYRNREHIREALPIIIDLLKEEGYEFVTVTDLLATRNPQLATQ